MIDRKNELFKKDGIIQQHLNYEDEEELARLANEVRDIEYASYELKDGIPRALDMLETLGCYVYIDCQRKKFPIHIVTDVKNIEFQFYINFDSIKQAEIKSNTRKGGHGHYNSFDNTSQKSYMSHKTQFENLEKPTKSNCDMILSGNCENIYQPKKYEGQENTLNYVIILIKAPRRVKASFSLSFTNERYIAMKDKLNFEVFSETHKRQLFGSQDQNNVIRILKSQRMSDTEGIMKKNIRIANCFSEHKKNLLTSMLKNLNVRTKDAVTKARHYHDSEIERKKILQKRNEFLKDRARESLEKQYNDMRNFMIIYFWRYLKRYYDIMSQIEILFNQKKRIYVEFQNRNSKARLLQKVYRYRFQFQTNATNSNQKLILNCIKIRCNFLKHKTKHRARKVIKTFINSINGPWIFKLKSLQYILTIKNMQRKWIKHIAIKKKCIEEIENNWSKEVIRLVEKEAEYKEMGIHYNIDNLKFLGADIRSKICSHQVDRQILQFTDVRYEVFEKMQDQKIADKVTVLIKQDDNVEDNIMNSKFGKGIVQTYHDSSTQPNPQILDQQMETLSSRFSNFFHNKKIVGRKSKFGAGSEIRIDKAEHQRASQRAKVGYNLIEESVLNLERRITEKSSRRSIIVKEVPEKSMQMLFDEDCGNYEFDSTGMWAELEDSASGKLYRQTLERIPDIIKAQEDYKKSLENDISPLMNKKVVKKSVLGKLFLVLNVFR